MANPASNPLVVKWFTSFVRSGLKALAGVLGAWGVLEGDETTSFVAELGPAIAVFALSQGWSMWVKYAEQRKLVVALVSPPGTTEAQVEGKIASGAPVPAAATPKNVVPVAAPPAVPPA